MIPSNAVAGVAAAAASAALLGSAAHGYAIHDVHRRDICGVWRLTSKRSFLPRFEDPTATTTTTSSSSSSHAAARKKKARARRPLKEFTVYPKKATKTKRLDDGGANIEEEEVLLMLSEDGSFMQYGAISPSELAEDEEDEGEDEGEDETQRNPKFGVVPQKKEEEEQSKGKSVMGLGVIKGTWDFLDGRLILASDRPEDVTDIRTVRDTMLVGDVVVKEEESLSDNPALAKTEGGGGAAEGGSESEAGNASSERKGSNPPIEATEGGQSGNGGGGGDGGGTVDVHLSVPRGSVEIGKFMYPKSHPSFFEQTMFEPVPTGSFQLRQVLGTLNTRTDDEEEEVGKFREEDLVGKRYFLTSYPIQRKRRGKKRWSIKYNKFVEDVKEKSEEEKKREESMPVPIRTMELELFPNMTFCTFAGFGSAKVLRGKWSIIGAEKDQFWMQVFRFGFGRSVSGSTYSEGMGLTRDDEKAYWGRISEIGKGSDEELSNDPDQQAPKDEGEAAKTVEVNGSVLDGWGLEPTTVAWFTMIENTEDFMEGYDDEDDDDDDGDDFDGRDSFKNHDSIVDPGGNADEDGDIFSSPDAFQ